jgi:hypothetical protein
VTVNGQAVDVAHAAASYEWVSFDITGPVDVAITAAEAGFWDRGVDIQPWRLGIRPVREGQTIRFHLAGPAKLSISRPGDFLNQAAMLFLFAGRRLRRRRRAECAHCSGGDSSGEPEPEVRRHLLSCAGAFIFGSLNLLEGWRGEGAGAGHDCVRGLAGPDHR